MRKLLVAGNWKMNGSRASVSELVGLLKKEDSFCQKVVCPPSVFLHLVQSFIEDSDIMLGAQNLDWHDAGAYTGELSGAMLIEAGCQYSMVGHSERRQLYFESAEQVACKFEACLKVGIKPILCLGETREQRSAGETNQVIRAQLKAVLERTGIEGFENAVVAYEPVWAIGTGETATPEQADAGHAVIRSMLAEKNEIIAENIQIIYGGSVNEKNAAELFEKQNIDGALVGGASLKAEEFLSICHSANKLMA